MNPIDTIQAEYLIKIKELRKENAELKKEQEEMEKTMNDTNACRATASTEPHEPGECIRTAYLVDPE